MNAPVLRHPGRWLWLLLLVPVVIGLIRLRFDVEIFDLLPNNLPVVQGLKIYQQYFANGRELIITVNSASAQSSEEAARKIAQALRECPDIVSTVTWEPPWQEHPEQAAELIAYLWFNQSPAIFRDLKNRLAATNLPGILTVAREELATSLSPQEMAQLSYDPFGLTKLPENTSGAAPAFTQGMEMFGSANGRLRIIYAQASQELSTYRDCDRWLRAIKPKVSSAIASVSSHDIQLRYTGRPAFVAETALGMQHDITISVLGTAGIIAILFWLAHRRVKPMLWLLTLLAIILGCTLALGGLIFGSISVVSMGFAAILLGLAVDYAVVHYQEALAQPHLSIPQIRHAIAPSIFWAAVTTISAFLVLNFGGLPGLGQLGTLVGLGVALAACIMIFEFLPPLFPDRRENRPESVSRRDDDIENRKPVSGINNRFQARFAFGLTLGVLLLSGSILVSGFPRVDPTAKPLRPRASDAYDALEQIQTNLNEASIMIVIGGHSEKEVARRLTEVESVLSRAKSNHLLRDFKTAAPLWPRPDFQSENRTIARDLAAEREVLRQAAKASGFAEPSLGLTERILDTWQVASGTQGVFWPSNSMSQWIFEKISSHNGTNFFTVGSITPAGPAHGGAALPSVLQAEMPRQEVWLSGWELLGGAIFSAVKANLWKVLSPMVGLVLFSLGLAFRRSREILLSLAVLLMSYLCLLASMRLAGWSWNLLNLMAIPLVLGTGVDYSIFMQLALRRHCGDLRQAYQSVGRALLLCGGTAVAGFGSLSWSSNAGMASLGRVCAIGIACNMLIAIFLLPVWWKASLPDS